MPQAGESSIRDGNQPKRPRWDKADLAAYYELSGVNLYSIFLEIKNASTLSNIVNYDAVIDHLYLKIVNALLISDAVIPRANASLYKHWWNDELDVYKNKAIEWFNLWATVGKPISGDILEKMRLAKMEYKMAINEYKDQCESKLTDDLSESLLDKNMNDFWKSWRNKFGKRDTKAKIVEGYNSNEDIVQAFKSFFSQTCVPNDPSTHLKHKKIFEREFAGYLENENEDVDSFFTVSDVDSAFLKMKKGKAVGVDIVSSEHLIYAHPCLVVSLKMLFNLMFFYGYVPTEFGKVTLIPLLKDSSADASLCENYRGISLSCAISKVFEYAVLCKFSSLFQTDSLQFGFRSEIGCSDALFTVKSVIDYFTKNGCTLTVSALDISKAFDRISFYALFSKLMARQLPKPIIRVLLSWYEKSFTSVKWNDCASEWFQVTAGVRQGGVLSPFLFAIYIEDVLKQLKLHGKGCKIGGVYLGCFLYADDILLISQSVSCMQDMLNICCKVANELDLKFNGKKSV